MTARRLALLTVLALPASLRAQDTLPGASSGQMLVELPRRLEYRLGFAAGTSHLDGPRPQANVACLNEA